MLGSGTLKYESNVRTPRYDAYGGSFSEIYPGAKGQVTGCLKSYLERADWTKE